MAGSFYGIPNLSYAANQGLSFNIKIFLAVKVGRKRNKVWPSEIRFGQGEIRFGRSDSFWPKKKTWRQIKVKLLYYIWTNYIFFIFIFLRLRFMRVTGIIFLIWPKRAFPSAERGNSVRQDSWLRPKVAEEFNQA